MYKPMSIDIRKALDSYHKVLEDYMHFSSPSQTAVYINYRPMELEFLNVTCTANS